MNTPKNSHTRQRGRWRIGLALAFTALFAVAARSADVSTPVGGQVRRFVASVYGPEAVWTNPAALSRYEATTFQFTIDYKDKKFRRQWGSVFTGGNLGYSFRKINGADSGPLQADYKEHILAYGFSMGDKIDGGLSYKHIPDGPGPFAKRHEWSFGALLRNSERLSVGATFSNLNKSPAAGERSPVMQTYGLAVRPLTGDALTVNVEAQLSHLESFRSADYSFGIESAAWRGVKLFGAVDDMGGFEIGARVNFDRSFVGGQGRFSKSGSSRDFASGSLYAGTVSGHLESATPPSDRTLDVRLSGEIEENPASPVFGQARPAFVDYIMGLHRAAQDPAMTGVFLTLSPNNLSLAQAQEIKSAITQVRARGKRVVAYLASASNKNFYIAVSANEILMSPVGYFNVVGLRAEQIFYAGSLEKIGVVVEAEKIAEYKTAPEQWTERGPSNESRGMVNRLLDTLNAQFMGEIARARHFDTLLLQELIDSAPLTPGRALEAGLVDRLVTPDEFVREIRHARGELTPLSAYVSEKNIRDRWTSPSVVALLVAEGEISSSPGADDFDMSGAVTPGAIDQALRSIESDRQVTGVTLRVNSPGGSAMASDLIYRLTQESRSRLLVTTSISSVAASGGYYIASAGEKIFINPASVTGSIGIFAVKPDLSGLYKKIDLRTETYLRGRNAGILSLSKPFSESERIAVRENLRGLYDRFVGVVADERGLSADSVNAIGRGQVWTGAEAIALGLADTTGGLWEAICHSSGLSESDEFPEIRRYPHRRSWFSRGKSSILSPFAHFVASVKHAIPGFDPLNSLGRELAQQFSEDGYQCRLPYDLVVE